MKRINTWIWVVACSLAAGLSVPAAVGAETIITEDGIVPVDDNHGLHEVVQPDYSAAELSAAHQRLLAARDRAETMGRQFFEDDFEDGNMDGWQSGGGGFTTTVTDTTAGGYSIYSMEIDGGFMNHYTGQYYVFNACTPEYMGVWLSSADETASDAYFVVGDTSTPSNNGIIFLYAKGTGYWNLYSGTAYVSQDRYGAYLWYWHEFLLDWNSRTVDWYVNGVLQHAGVPFRASSTTAVSRVYAHNYNDSVAWFDEYYFADTGPGPTPTPEPTFTPAPSPTTSFTPCNNDGDVTRDGEITAGDAQLAFQIVLGFHTPNWEEACAADCNGDDEITAGDAQLIFQTALMMASCADPMI
ncbi:MAG TPA: dockerin type I domain-containing protein [bacterium]|nr:dockerin type I domain-containing protein [bacterium]